MSQLGRCAVGHPIDVASGTLFEEFEDFVLPGQIPLVFSRRYSSALVHQDQGMFGPSWSSPFEMRLGRDLEGFRLIDADGESSIIFDDPDNVLDAGAVIRNVGSFSELRKRGRTYIVTRWDTNRDTVAEYVFPEWRGHDWLPLIARHNLEGQGIDLEHDRSGRIVRVTQRRERRGLSLSYDHAGRVVEVHAIADNGAERLVLRYSYDADGFLAEMVDALSQRARYWYGFGGRMVREENAAGLVFDFAWDSQGRCVETKASGEYGLERLEFRPLERTTRVTNSRGHVTTYNWNERGQVFQHVSPLGQVTATDYDEHGRLVKQVLPNGGVFTHQFDERGDRVLITGPSGAETRFFHNDVHRIVGIVDPSGATWSRTFDEANRPLAIVNPLGERLSYGYDAQGDLVWIENPAGHRCAFAWDAAGNLISADDWVGHRRTFEYGPEGQLAGMVDALGQRTRVLVDALGRINQIQLADGAVRTFTWDAYDQPLEHVDRAGAVTRWQYELSGMLAQVVRPDGARIRFRWGTIPGQLQDVINERGERYHFDYDADDGLVRAVDFAQRSTVYERQAGELVAIVDPAGHRTACRRNLDGAITEIAWEDGSRTTYAYDAKGVLIRADNGQCPVERRYDAAGRCISERQGAHEIQHTYNASGDRTRRASSLGYEAAFTWTANGQLASLDLGASRPIQFVYDALRRETERSIEGGIAIRQAWDSQSRRTEQFVGRHHAADRAAGVEPIVRRQYRYDAASNLLQVLDDHWGETAYVYDAASRIVETGLAGGGLERFQYDDTDNVVALTRQTPRAPDAATDACEYEAGDVLLRRGDTSYTYNPLGQLVTREEGARGATRFEWNRVGQLAGVTSPDGGQWRYQYDAFNRRVRKIGPDETTEFVWDGHCVLHEIHYPTNGSAGAAPDAADRRVVHWEYEPFRFNPIARVEDGRVLLAVNDVAGNPRELVDTTGEVAWAAQFTTWGAAHQSSGSSSTCPLRFQGQWFDAETGLHYNRFRYYDPQVGRFISPDPLGLFGGPNEFSYAPNPIGWVDPYGLAKRCPDTPEEDFVLVQRVEQRTRRGGKGEFGNRRVDVDTDGNVVIMPAAKGKDPALHISIDNPARTDQFLAQREAKRPGESVIREFEVPRSVAERLTENAVPQAPGASARPGQPLIVDQPHPGQFAFHPDDAAELARHARPGSFRTREPP